MAFENYLKNIYYNPSNPASFSGPDKLYQFVKKDGKYMISKYRIRKWLQREDAFSLQRESRKPIKRSRIVVAGIDDQWSADLMDMVKFAKSNQGVRFISFTNTIFSNRFASNRFIEPDLGLNCLQSLLTDGISRHKQVSS